MRRLAVVLVLVVPLFACSAAPGGADAAIDDASAEATVDASADAIATMDAGHAGDAASDVSSAPDSSNSGVQCTSITVPAHVTPITSSATPPTPAGGTIATGLYHLTAATWYGASKAPGAFGVAWDVSSTDVADADDMNGYLNTETTSYTTSGSDITFTTLKCPSVSPNGTVRKYTATSTTISVLWDDNGATVVFDFTKQ
jgi:hypothetical protein